MLAFYLVSLFLAVAAALDGWSTDTAIKLGATEVGPGKIFLGETPSTKRIIVAGIYVIGAEIWLAYLWQLIFKPDEHYIVLVPLFVQGVVHLVFARQNHKRNLEHEVPAIVKSVLIGKTAKAPR